MQALNILIAIFAFANFASSQIPLVNLAANATAGIAANSTQNWDKEVKKDAFGRVFLELAQNQGAGANNQSENAEDSNSDSTTNNTAQVEVETEQKSNNAEKNPKLGENNEVEAKNEAGGETGGDLTIDETLKAGTDNTNEIDESLEVDDPRGEQEVEEGEIQDPKPKKSKNGKRIEKLVCHAEIEIDPEEPIFAENFEKYFE